MAGAATGCCVLLTMATSTVLGQGSDTRIERADCKDGAAVVEQAVENAAPTAGTVAAPRLHLRFADGSPPEAGVDSDAVEALASLGLRVLQETRETADYSLLVRVEEAFTRIHDIDADDAEAILGLGSIALTRHEFDTALALGHEALDVTPTSARAMGIIVDALIELGRYEEAGDALDMMLRTRPDLSSYTRLSYFHELHGRDDLAIDAMERAVIAAGPVPENTEFARVLLGDLWLQRGDTARARCLYLDALAQLPAYVPALRGLAETAAAEGDLDGAIALLQRAVAQTPLPSLLVMLAETQEAAGDLAAARAGYQLVRDIEGLQRSQGVAADPGFAVFEVDHGDPVVALQQARDAYAASPGVRAADALAWSLHANGLLDEAQTMSDAALELGWQDATALYHAGAIALSRGDSSAATTLLMRSLERNPGAWSLLRARTQAALERASLGEGS